MARTADDLALLWDVLAGVRAPVGGVAGMRVALWVDEPGYPVSAEVRGAVERAGDALRAQGAHVEIATPPFGDGTCAGNDVYMALLLAVLGARNLTPEQWAAFAANRPADPGPRYRLGSFVHHSTGSYRDYALAAVARQRLKDRLAEWFTGWDAILCPVGPVPAFPHQHEGTLFDRDLDVDGSAVPYGHLFDWIALATACHLPAVAAPAGATTTGLPLGVQLIGRWDEEARLLDLARALEAELGRPAPPPSDRRRVGRVPRFTRDELEAARSRVVPDLLPGPGDPPLRVLFCGINPGLVTAATGHHFGRPGNRFWPALHGSGFTPRLLLPAEQDELAGSGPGHHQHGRPHHRPGRRALRRRAGAGGERLRAARGAPRAGVARRRRHRRPTAWRSPGRRPRSGRRTSGWGRPGCGCCPTPAASTRTGSCRR